MKINHAPITFSANPLVDQSRGFHAQINHESITINHANPKPAGRSITQSITGNHDAINHATHHLCKRWGAVTGCGVRLREGNQE